MQIPVFQPGTIMFNSAVKANSSRAKSAATLNSPNKDFADGAPMHTNGLILSTRDALFLARFLANLSKTYVSLCECSSPQTTKTGDGEPRTPVRTYSFAEESPQQEVSSPDSIPSPTKRQATMSSILYRDSPSPFKLEPSDLVEKFRFDVYQSALASVLEEFSEEDFLYYGR